MLEIPVGMVRTLREIRSHQHQHCCSSQSVSTSEKMPPKITQHHLCRHHTNEQAAENGISQQPVKKHGISFFCVRSVPLLNVTSFSTSVIIWGKVSMFTLHCALCVGNVQRFQCSVSNALQCFNVSFSTVNCVHSLCRYCSEGSNVHLKGKQ